jgi:hypothetical protein
VEIPKKDGSSRTLASCGPSTVSVVREPTNPARRC